MMLVLREKAIVLTLPLAGLAICAAQLHFVAKFYCVSQEY